MRPGVPWVVAVCALAAVAIYMFSGAATADPQIVGGQTTSQWPAIGTVPAGLGDMAIGIVAPSWIVALTRNPEVATSARFRLWNALGILDFVIAFTTATICAMTITDSSAPSIAPMGQLPLVLIPEFMVPLFLMLHIIALMKKRDWRRGQ